MYSFIYVFYSAFVRVSAYVFYSIALCKKQFILIYKLCWLYLHILIHKLINSANSTGTGFILSYFITTRLGNKIQKNLENSNVGNTKEDRKLIINDMWGNYGRILSEYLYLKQFRKNKLNKFIEIEGENYLNEIKKNNDQVVFVSGHFNNFELMAMQIEKAGIELATIYRPLNNFLLNKTMEQIRTENICKNQIKKGRAGSREIIKNLIKGKSIAIMIDPISLIKNG